jgi:hypothetical protein
MAEQKRGFHALEKRIHELEEEDRPQAQRGAAPEKEQPKREAPAAGGKEKGEK